MPHRIFTRRRRKHRQLAKRGVPSRAETPMPAGGAYHAASAFPAYMQHAVHNPAYAAAYAQQYAQVQQAQQQAMLQQMTLASQYPPAYGMGMWQQNVPQQQ